MPTTTHSTPERYQPETRLVDDPDELHTLYVARGLTIREIASHHATVGRQTVYEALDEHGIINGGRNEGSDDASDGDRGIDPPQVDWSTVA